MDLVTLMNLPVREIANGNSAPPDEINLIRQLFGLTLDGSKDSDSNAAAPNATDPNSNTHLHTHHIRDLPHPECPFCRLVDGLKTLRPGNVTRYRVGLTERDSSQVDPPSIEPQHIHGKVCSAPGNVGLVVEHQLIPSGRLFIPQVPRGIMAARNFRKHADPKIEGYAQAMLDDMDHEDPENAIKLRNFLNRNKKGPKVKNLFAHRMIDPFFESPIRPQPPAHIVRRINMAKVAPTHGPFYQFSKDMSLDRLTPITRIKDPRDFIPPSTRTNIQVTRGYPFDIETEDPDLWMRIVCVFLFRQVEKFVHERGFYGWAEKYAWFKNSAAKSNTYRYFDPAKAELNLAHKINVYLHPPEREFLHLAMDFLTKSFFFLPGSDVFDMLSIVTRLLDDSFIEKDKVDDVIWRRITGDFGAVGEFPQVKKKEQATPPPGTPSSSTSSYSSSDTHEHRIAEEKSDHPESY